MAENVLERQIAGCSAVAEDTFFIMPISHVQGC